MSATLSNSVLETNPYEGHPNLSELEAEVLWQYAKLSQNIKEVRPFLPPYTLNESVQAMYLPCS